MLLCCTEGLSNTNGQMFIFPVLVTRQSSYKPGAVVNCSGDFARINTIRHCIHPFTKRVNLMSSKHWSMQLGTDNWVHHW